ncbi:MAG: FKBP-type peptidyl-prolyl cis-trans isomerase [Betaproteobacteria bacterium]
MRIDMHDAQGVELSPPTEVDYLHGHDGLLPALERALEGKGPGESLVLQLEPEDAFGEYDAELLRVEPLERYGEGLRPGMEIEDSFDGDEPRVYRVTDIAGGTAVLDANHPLAGMALRFSVVILTVRSATAEELKAGVSLP